MMNFSCKKYKKKENIFLKIFLVFQNFDSVFQPPNGKFESPVYPHDFRMIENDESTASRFSEEVDEITSESTNLTSEQLESPRDSTKTNGSWSKVAMKTSGTSTKAYDNFVNNLKSKKRPSFLKKNNHIGEQWWDLDFVFQNYKVHLCPKTKSNKSCKYSTDDKQLVSQCPYYHSDDDRRRPIERPQNPKSSIGYYKAQGCRYALVKGNAVGGMQIYDINNCGNKDKCQYSHSRYEIQFHPIPWKTKECNDSDTLGKCPRHFFCPYKHKDDEKYGFKFIANTNVYCNF